MNIHKEQMEAVADYVRGDKKRRVKIVRDQELLERKLEIADFYRDMEREMDCE